MTFPRYSKYKPSGVEWLGEIPAHWDVKTLRHLGRLLKGSGGSKEDVVDDGVPCVRYGDLYTTHRYFIKQARTFLSPERAEHYTPLQYGDVLFAASGEKLAEIGKSAVNLMKGESRCGGDLILLRPNESVVPKFLGYAGEASPSILQKASMGRGTTVKHIYPDELRHLVITIPPLQEQAAIADFLDRGTANIDALMAEQKQLVELLKEKRRAVVSHAVTKGLNADAPMRDSGIEWLGRVPAHWHAQRLKHISPAITVGIVVNPSTFVADHGLPFIYGGDVREGAIDWENARRISSEHSAAHDKTRLREGDLITVRVGAPGVTAVVPSECDGGNCASVMLVRRGDFDPQWLCFAMNDRVVRSQVEVVQYGAAQEQFNISHAVNFWLPVPPRHEQEQIASTLQVEVGRIDALVGEAERGITLLQERRAGLITAAVTGQIDVRNVARRAA